LRSTECTAEPRPSLRTAGSRSAPMTTTETATSATTGQVSEKVNGKLSA
jgi:hypothetical protein